MAYNPIDPNGQATMANSAPVVVASDQSAILVKPNDGTNTVNILAGDTGYNGLVTADATDTLTFTTSVAGAQVLLDNTDVRGYASVILVFTSIGSGLALQPQFAPNSGGTYASVDTASIWNVNASRALITSGYATSGLYTFEVTGNYFHLNISALTSGTVSGYVILSTRTIDIQNAVYGSGQNIGAGILTGLKNSGGQFDTAISVNGASDGGAGGIGAVGPFTYNGASWDKIRSLTNYGSGLSGVSGLGAVMAGILGQYNTTPPNAVSGLYYVPQLTTKAQWQSVLFDAAGNNRGANVNASNQLSVSLDGLTTSNALQVNVQDGNGTKINSTSQALNVSIQNASLPVTQSGNWGVTASLATLSTVVNLAQLAGTTPTFTGSNLNVNIGNAMPWEVKLLDGSDSDTDAVPNTNTSTLANNGSPVKFKELPYVFNGSTWDRLRSVAGASGATLSTGILAAGSTGFYAAGNYNSLPSLSYGIVSIDSQGRQYVQAPTASGAAIPGNIFAVGGQAGSNLQPFSISGNSDAQSMVNALQSYAFESIYNGSSNDRVRALSVVQNSIATTGVFGAGAIGQYYPTYPSLASGAFGVVSVDSQAKPYVQAPTAIGSTPPVNAFYIGGTDGANLQGIKAFSDADASGNTNSLVAAGRAYTYNGASWDRVRSVATAQNTLGLGIPTSGAFGQYLPSYTSLASGAYGILQIDSQGRLVTAPTGGGSNVNVTQFGGSNVTLILPGVPLVAITDSSGNKLNSTSNALNVNVQNASIPVTQSGFWIANATLPQFTSAAALADATTNPTTTLAGSLLEAFNGSTWDRVRNLTSYLGSGVSAIGVQSAGVLGQYNSSLPTAVSGLFYVPQLTSKAQLQTVLFDAAGNARGANVNASNQLSVSLDGSTATLNTSITNTTLAVTQSGNWGVTASIATLSTVVNVQQLGGTAPTYTSNNLNVNIGNASIPVTQSGFWSSNASLPQFTAAAALADGTTNPTTTLSGALNEVFNGSTWDRMRSIQSASGSSGVGALAAAMLGQYSGLQPASLASNSLYIPQVDQAGNLRSMPGMSSTFLAYWSASTPSLASLTIYNNSGAPSALFQIDQGSTVTAGAITFAVTYDGSNWVTPPASAILDPTSTSWNQLAIPYTLQATTNKPFLVASNGWQALSVQLSTKMTGTATLSMYYSLLPVDPVDAALAYPASPTAAAVPSNAFYTGGRSQVTEATAAANAQVSAIAMDVVGKPIVMPFANKELFVSGLANTSTTNSTQVVPAQAGSYKFYMTGFSIANTGATNTLVTFQNGSGTSLPIWTTIAPTVGGSNFEFLTPVATSAAKGLFFQLGSSSASVYVAVTGYAGT